MLAYTPPLLSPEADETTRALHTLLCSTIKENASEHPGILGRFAKSLTSEPQNPKNIAGLIQKICEYANNSNYASYVANIVNKLNQDEFFPILRRFLHDPKHEKILKLISATSDTSRLFNRAEDRLLKNLLTRLRMSYPDYKTSNFESMERFLIMPDSLIDDIRSFIESFRGLSADELLLLRQNKDEFITCLQPYYDKYYEDFQEIDFPEEQQKIISILEKNRRENIPLVATLRREYVQILFKTTFSGKTETMLLNLHVPLITQMSKVYEAFDVDPSKSTLVLMVAGNKLNLDATPASLKIANETMVSVREVAISVAHTFSTLAGIAGGAGAAVAGEEREATPTVSHLFPQAAVASVSQQQPTLFPFDDLTPEFKLFLLNDKFFSGSEAADAELWKQIEEAYQESYLGRYYGETGSSGLVAGGAGGEPAISVGTSSLETCSFYSAQSPEQKILDCISEGDAATLNVLLDENRPINLDRSLLGVRPVTHLVNVIRRHETDPDFLKKMPAVLGILIKHGMKDTGETIEDIKEIFATNKLTGSITELEIT